MVVYSDGSEGFYCRQRSEAYGPTSLTEALL
ncbi:hypothetical protein Ccrd_019331 [Cynara cardunculus var. scolymus]|uniref:Uncharacterized protein n=1 Tax=Cynara cardunculus var. scolymus TaxID=59895 RepID=A0A103Y4K8_CYNCS|nr:hypothetical protein Ccrd_019331 [Cynara cardunculus var. scolymus]